MSRAIKEITVLYGSGYNAWISTMLEIEIEKKRIRCLTLSTAKAGRFSLLSPGTSETSFICSKTSHGVLGCVKAAPTLEI